MRELRVPQPGTRIFSSLAGARLYDTIGRYVYLFERLTAVSAGRFYRFKHIVSYSSGKVVGKVEALDVEVIAVERSRWQTSPDRGDSVCSRNPVRLESLRRKNHHCVTEIPQGGDKRAQQQGGHSPSP